MGVEIKGIGSFYGIIAQQKKNLKNAGFAKLVLGDPCIHLEFSGVCNARRLTRHVMTFAHH